MYEKTPLVGFILLFAACNITTVNPDDARACETETTGDNWTEFGFSATITKPEECPIPLDTRGQLMPIVGEVTVPTGEAKWADGEVRMLDAKEIEILWFPLFYVRDLSRDEHIASIDETYEAGWWKEPALVGASGFRDTVIFKSDVEPVGGGADVPVRGGVDLPYTHDPQPEVNGSTSVGLGDFYTLSAWSRNGATPLSYTWYKEGEQVATGDTYNGYAGSSGFFNMSVVVEDVEGDQGTVGFTLYVSDTDDGQCFQEPCEF